MGRNRQPVKLIELKGRSNHLTNEEKKKREAQEIKTPKARGIVPDHLSAKQKETFHEYASQLIALDIYSDLDRETLAAYVVASDEFAQYTRAIRQVALRINGKLSDENLSQRKALALERDRAFKIARATAGDLGLTVTSRCKIVIPEVEEKPENKFAAFVQ